MGVSHEPDTGVYSCTTIIVGLQNPDYVIG